MPNGKPSVYTVTAVNHHISSLFQQDPVLDSIYVKGELSNVKYASSGHLYFSLKDETSQIKCAMWASNVRKMKERLRDGDSVIVYGQIAVYERDGTYQLYASAMRRDGGVGKLYEQFEALKKKLLELGMFDASYKKPIPAYVRTLGVVTARTGAAVRDIITVSRRRNPGIQILLYPAQVQGDGAADSICEGIRTLDESGMCDVILVGRGGGSIEDLWAFNEEKVAYAIWNCSTPVISAVGHETDTTIADFVADLRAATPSAGAELAVVDMAALQRTIREKAIRIAQLMYQAADRRKQILLKYQLVLQMKGPEGRLRQSMQFLAQTSDRIDSLMDRKLEEMKRYLERCGELMDQHMNEHLRICSHRYELYSEKIKALSPQAKLDAGYAYVEDAKKRPLRSAGDVKKDDLLTIRLKDGTVKSIVTQSELTQQTG